MMCYLLFILCLPTHYHASLCIFNKNICHEPKKVFFALFWIRIRMFLDLPDPHPDPYQNVTDPETLFFYYFFVLKTPPIQLKEMKV
jgi:hypothetical protein